MPLLSVILPAYNAEKYIYNSVDSILKQTFDDFTLFVIDDGSKDNTVKILESINDQRLVIIKNEVNKGLIFTLNKGISLSKAYKYIARMDADDISLPDRFSKQISFLEANEHIGLLGSSMLQFGDKKSDEKKIYRPDSPEKIASTFFFYNPISHPAVMMRTKIIDKNYSYDFPKYEDYHLWIELFKNTKFYNLNDILIKYRRHSNNITSTYKENVEEDHNYMIKLITLFCQSSNIKLQKEEIEVISIISSNVRYKINPKLSLSYLLRMKESISLRLNESFDLDYFNYLFLERVFSYFFYFKRIDKSIAVVLKMNSYERKKFYYSVLNLNKN